MNLPDVEFCPAIREYVSIDQTQCECAVGYGCIKDAECCPLGLCFRESRPIDPYFMQPYSFHHVNRGH